MRKRKEGDKQDGLPLLFSWSSDEPYGGSPPNRGTIHREGDEDKTTVTYTDPKGRKITVTIPRTNKEDGPDKTTIYAYNAKAAEGGDDFGDFTSGNARQFVYRKIFVICGADGTGCKTWKFVQLKRALVTITRPGFPEQQVFPAPGGDPDAWSLDLPEDAAAPPEFPQMKGFKGPAKSAGMIDEPGFVNPWVDDPQAGTKFPKGTKTKATYKFRTFILCCDPHPRALLGCFTWGFEQTLEITGASTARQTINPDPCMWHPSAGADADYTAAKRDLDRIVNDKAFPKFCE